MSFLKPDPDVVIRSTYSPKIDASINYFEPTLTHQSFSEETDIDHIIKKYGASAFDLNYKMSGRYEDVTYVQDYQSSLNQVQAAKDRFMTMPAAIRSKFDNDPGRFLDFVSKEENLSAMADMGLLTPEAAQRIDNEKKSAAAQAALKAEGLPA